MKESEAIDSSKVFLLQREIKIFSSKKKFKQEEEKNFTKTAPQPSRRIIEETFHASLATPDQRPVIDSPLNNNTICLLF